MNKKAYVSVEVAKLLKQKGFDWKVFHFYDEEGHLKYREGDCYSLYNWNYLTKDEYGSHYCSAPTQQMACDWVEKTYGFFIEISRSIDLNGDYLYRYAILDKRNFVSKLNYIYKSKEDAVEAALEYVLTNLI